MRARSAGASPSKTIGVRERTGFSRCAPFVQLFQIGLAALFRKPDDLEEVVALGRTVGVVVDRLAGPREHSRRNVVFAQDQVGVVFAALKRDAHGHLAQRAAGQGESPAQALRAQDDVDAEGSALADQAVEPQGGLLGELVFLAEELLELVDDQQDAGQRGACPGRCDSRSRPARRRRGTGRPAGAARRRAARAR